MEQDGIVSASLIGSTCVIVILVVFVVAPLLRRMEAGLAGVFLFQTVAKWLNSRLLFAVACTGVHTLS